MLARLSWLLLSASHSSTANFHSRPEAVTSLRHLAMALLLAALSEDFCS